MTQTPTEYLPEVLQRIEDCAGHAAMLLLAHDRAGVRITIPKRIEGSTLSEIVGIAAAEKIAKEFGHGSLLIPCGPYSGEGGRREAVRRAIRDKQTASGAALAAGVSERTAWRVKAGMKDGEPETLPLFGEIPKRNSKADN